MEDKLGKGEQKKKKKNLLYRVSPRENPISFLKDFLLPGERNERNKREWENRLIYS